LPQHFGSLAKIRAEGDQAVGHGDDRRMRVDASRILAHWSSLRSALDVDAIPASLRKKMG
jgi:hypothetical protein